MNRLSGSQNISGFRNKHIFTMSLLLATYILMFGLKNGNSIRWLGIYRLRRTSEYPTERHAPVFSPGECQLARRHLGFKSRQYRFCTDRKLGHAMLAVLRAARAVGYHCPRALKDRRWNCSSVEHLPRLSPELKLGTREQALVLAYASAALIFEIGRYCALNKIHYCSCGSSGAAQIYGMESQQMSRLASFGNKGQPDWDATLGTAISYGRPSAVASQEAFSWSGCPDNTAVALSYVDEFLGLNGGTLRTQYEGSQPSHSAFYGQSRRRLEVGPSWHSDEAAMHPRLPRQANNQSFAFSKGRSSKQRRESLQHRMKLHNYIVGTSLTITNQKLSCKCHGVSGSCAQKVCFRQLQRVDMPAIRDTIKRKYLAAKHVSGLQYGNLIASIFKENTFVKEPVGPEDMVFSEHSPDYCNPEPRRGAPGTQGRFCSSNDTGSVSCLNMCCGRGHRDVTYRTVDQCKCMMQSNFRVKCQTCVNEELRHMCL